MPPRERRRKAVVTLGRAPIVDTTPAPSANEVSRAPRAQAVARSVRSSTQELLTPRELAARLKIDPATVYRMTRSRELPFVPVGKRVRYDFSDVLTKLRGGGNNNGSGE